MNRACDERPTGLDKIYRKKNVFLWNTHLLKETFCTAQKKNANLNEAQYTKNKLIIIHII